MKFTIFGIVLILAGIATIIWNYLFAPFISLTLIPLVGLLMIAVGVIFIRRAISGY